MFTLYPKIEMQSIIFLHFNECFSELMAIYGLAWEVQAPKCIIMTNKL